MIEMRAARSPDLPPFDHFLWGYLKSTVYLNRLENLKDFKVYVMKSETLADFTEKVQQEFIHHLGHCQIVSRAGEFEH